MKGLRAYLGFTALGLRIAVALFAYLAGTDYTRQGGLFTSAAIVLCPLCLFSLAFIDAEPAHVRCGPRMEHYRHFERALLCNNRSAGYEISAQPENQIHFQELYLSLTPEQFSVSGSHFSLVSGA